eukprot:jgi/Orpsp1_1/1191086/evm.model.d7180000083394.1
MKVYNILPLVFAALAVKVSANECFSTELGYPCCVETNEIAYVDEDGEWGVENNDWCGIAKLNFADEALTNTNNTLEQDQQSQSVNNTPIPVPSDYMSKLQVVNVCPADARTKQSNVNYPSAQKISYFSTTTNSERKMNIILPVNYNENKKYPVLYYLHGIMGDEDSMLDETAIALPTNLFNSGKAKEMIIVLPNEYAPAPGTEVEPSFTQEFFDGYDNFINDLVNDIMPYMEQHYSILTGKENTAVCGFSMGGRNSLYIGYSRPDLFGYVGAFSPAPGLVPGHDTFSGDHKGLFQESELRADDPPFVTLISCGTNDNVVFEFPKSYHEILTRNNQEHIWFEVPGADHDTDAIAAGFYNFVSATFDALNN